MIESYSFVDKVLLDISEGYYCAPCISSLDGITYLMSKDAESNSCVAGHRWTLYYRGFLWRTIKLERCDLKFQGNQQDVKISLFNKDRKALNVLSRTLSNGRIKQRLN